MKIKYENKGYRLITPCPHGYGYLSYGKWGPGAEHPVMVGSSICSLDCPYNEGVNMVAKICSCNYPNAVDK